MTSPGTPADRRPAGGTLTAHALRQAVLRIGLVATAAGVLSYAINHRLIERGVSDQLRLSTQERLQREALPFLEIQTRNANAIREFLELRANKARRAELLRDFDLFFTRRPDGAWVSRDALYDGVPLPDGRVFRHLTAVLNPGVELTDDLRVRLAASVTLVENYGNNGEGRHIDFGLIFPEGGLTLYWPGERYCTGLVFDGPKAFRIRDHDWFNIGFAAPGPGLARTGMYLDTPSGQWLVSNVGLCPVQPDGSQPVSAITDLSLADLMRRAAKPGIPGTDTVILRADAGGTLIFHPELNGEIQKTNGLASVVSTADAGLLAVLKAAADPAVKAGQPAIVDTPGSLVACGVIPGTDWLLAVRHPKALMRPAILNNLGIVAAVGLLTLLVEVFLLRSILQNQVARPLSQLIRAAKGIGDPATGFDTGALPAGAGGEIGDLAEAFRAMAARLRKAFADAHAGEEELRRHRDHLEDMVANRTAELAAAKVLAEEGSRAKSAFLATMSHEIRTPMNGVLGMAELMSHTRLDANQREQLAMIRGSGEVLLSVINDILDFSKIEAGRMELEKVGFSLHGLTGRTLQALAPQAAAKGLELELDIPADLPDLRLGDPGRLRQVMTNLVGNAIKFTRHGWVRVTVSAAGGADGLRLEVTDTGEGISQEAQAKLFQPFTQADASTTRKHGGTGLGLAISARLIGQMGGTIGVASEPGRGSTFWFEVSLPPAKAEEVAGQEDQMPGTLPMLAGKSALVVDDNAINRAVACAQMRRWGMRVAEAVDAASALAQLRATSGPDRPGYDLALLDGMMPEMDGWQLAAAIRDIPGCAGLPLVMASSAGTSGSERAESRLFRRFLQKPLRPAQLAGALAEILTGWHPESVAAAPLAGRLARVLLVEDMPVNQRVARAMLEKAGHQVTVAENGAVALAKLEQPELFDIVLMDCLMPEMDGFEATRRLRQRERERGWKPYRVVAMTANAMQGDREACLEAGMDDYLAKPVRMDLLRRAVANQG